MTYPVTTAFFTGLFALIHVGLSAWVVAGRVSTDTLHGQGDDPNLEKRIRTQANFAEYVPFALLAIGFAEAGGAGATLVRTLLIVLLVARILHPFGMFAAKNSPAQFVCRGGGILATFGVLATSAIWLLMRAS